MVLSRIFEVLKSGGREVLMLGGESMKGGEKETWLKAMVYRQSRHVICLVNGKYT